MCCSTKQHEFTYHWSLCNEINGPVGCCSHNEGDVPGAVLTLYFNHVIKEFNRNIFISPENVSDRFVKIISM